MAQKRVRRGEARESVPGACRSRTVPTTPIKTHPRDALWTLTVIMSDGASCGSGELWN